MKVSSELFENEGNENLERTVRVVAEAATLYSVDTIVAFTALGEGALRLRELLPEANVRIVAVTFPAESFATSGDVRVKLGIPDSSTRDALLANDIAIVQAAMPFRGFDAVAMSSTARVIRQSLSIFGGGMNLCVQAVLMACDAGHLKTGHRCIAFSGDTAIVTRAAHTHSFLSPKSRFMVEHILCKPLQYQITRSTEGIDNPKRVSRPQAQLPTNISASEGSEVPNTTPIADPSSPGGKPA